MDYFTKLTQISQSLEQLLQTRYNAEGRGLHEKLTSVECQVPLRVQKKIRYIATIRNKATHENVDIARENFDKVQEAYKQIQFELNGGSSRRQPRSRDERASSNRNCNPARRKRSSSKRIRLSQRGIKDLLKFLIVILTGLCFGICAAFFR